MNRGEQENLFRQSHTFRVQQDGMNKAHKLHLENLRRKRGFSQGNIHHLSSLNPHTAHNSRSFGEERLTTTYGRACDDLVLSVLKTPVRDAAAAAMLQLTTLKSTATESPQTPAAVVGRATTATTATPVLPPQQLPILPTAHSPSRYQPLQYGCSEDELVDDVESAKETTKLSGFLHSDEEDGEGGKEGRRKSSSGGGFKFLRRFRTGRSPKIEEHHRRCGQMPLRRRSRGRAHADILDGVAPNSPGKLFYVCFGRK